MNKKVFFFRFVPYNPFTLSPVEGSEIIPSFLSSYFDVLSIDSTVAISPLSLEKLGYLNKKKQMDNKEEVRDEEMSKDSLKNRGGRRTETKITHLFMSDPSDFYGRAGQQELQAHVVQRNLDEMVI